MYIHIIVYMYIFCCLYLFLYICLYITKFISYLDVHPRSGTAHQIAPGLDMPSPSATLDVSASVFSRGGCRRTWRQIVDTQSLHTKTKIYFTQILWISLKNIFSYFFWWSSGCVLFPCFSCWYTTIQGALWNPGARPFLHSRSDVKHNDLGKWYPAW